MESSSVDVREKICPLLRELVGLDRFNLWFSEERASFHVTCTDESRLFVGLENLFQLEWVKTTFGETIRAVAKACIDGRAIVEFRIDPALFQERREKEKSELAPFDRRETRTAPAAEKPKLLLDVAPLPPQLDRIGLRHEIVSIPARGAVLVRAVGEPVPFWLHYGLPSGERPCFGEACRICDDQGPKRVRVAYFDAIRVRGSGLECFRVVQQVPEGVANRMPLDGSETIRGRLYRFQKVPRDATRIEVVQEGCPHALDEPIDVRLVIGRRYGLRKWPNQDRELGEK